MLFFRMTPMYRLFARIARGWRGRGCGEGAGGGQPAPSHASHQDPAYWSLCVRFLWTALWKAKMRGRGAQLLPPRSLASTSLHTLNKGSFLPWCHRRPSSSTHGPSSPTHGTTSRSFSGARNRDWAQVIAALDRSPSGETSMYLNAFGGNVGGAMSFITDNFARQWAEPTTSKKCTFPRCAVKARP